MNCEDIKLMLLEYVMEEVSGNDRTEIAFHLESCAECSEEAGKLRQTLEAMAQGAAFEDIPQKIRIVAEPASWWIAFWRHPARLALAASGLACVAIAMLALASATIQYQNGNFEVAFGAAAPSIQSLSNQSPAAASLPSIASLAPAVTQTLSREDVVRLIAEAVAASEARQSAGAVRIVNAAAQLRFQGDSVAWARIAIGAVAPTPLLVPEAAEALVGRPLSDATVRAAAEAAKAAARPIDDMRGSIKQRRHLVGVLVERTLREAAARARGS